MYSTSTGRIFIYPKDIAIITGKHITTARIIYNKLLDSLSKTKFQGLTIKEYCTHTGSDEKLIASLLK